MNTTPWARKMVTTDGNIHLYSHTKVSILYFMRGIVNPERGFDCVCVCVCVCVCACLCVCACARVCLFFVRERALPANMRLFLRLRSGHSLLGIRRQHRRYKLVCEINARPSEQEGLALEHSGKSVNVER